MKTCNAYRPLLAQADTVLKWYMWQMGYSKTQASLPVVDACQLFYRLLAVKYRVGPAELDLMGMPQESDYVAALRYFLNAPEIDAQFARPEVSDAVGV